MNKLYDRIDFVNNTTPALNQTNLNKLSKAVDDIDDRVIDIAGDVITVVPEILDKYADIEALATNPPYIGQNGHWWTWDTDTNQYVDSGVDAGVSVTVGTTTTLSPGSSATVTNSGTDTDPILNFGIPQGAAGQDGADGVSPEVTIATITGGHTVTITDADHPSGQSFNVMDGQDGSAGVGVPSGGTTGQVLKKKSGTDYDTEWQNESGGSGGHTILNSSGTSMTQRTNLQFSGMSVSDDSANDKTVVTPLTPDYVDAQYNNTTQYSKGMTCISGNKRYRYINNTASSGHTPPNATYWEELSVAEECRKGIIPLRNIANKVGMIGNVSFSKIREAYGAYYTTYSNGYDYVEFTAPCDMFFLVTVYGLSFSGSDVSAMRYCTVFVDDVVISNERFSGESEPVITKTGVVAEGQKVTIRLTPKASAPVSSYTIGDTWFIRL